MTCDSKDNVGATHNNAQLKNEIILPWKAPIFSEGPAKNVEFKFTVVKDYSTFWIAKPATNTVTVTKIEAESEPETEAETGNAEAETGYPEAEGMSPLILHLATFNRKIISKSM